LLNKAIENFIPTSKTNLAMLVP